ncbi:unnamed protein product [Rangifer tarandus platyrhynchus]|uniref:Uncharacterized protein n=1 Tax=Rangifer tarandus platyrhynchus TaxID=3082113 RepID=A0AC59YES1_RANTA
MSVWVSRPFFDWVGFFFFMLYVCLVPQSCLTPCDPMDCSLPGSSVHGILQTRILEWVAIPFSRGSSQPRDRSGSLALQADSLLSEIPGKPKKYSIRAGQQELASREQVRRVTDWRKERKWEMAELKNRQQQEMEGKLQFHSHLTLTAQVLVPCWLQIELSTFLKEGSSDA